MATRQDEPANGCKAGKEELLNKKKNPLDIDDDCPICRDDYSVLCRVANHPSRPLLPSPGIELIVSFSNSLIHLFCSWFHSHYHEDEQNRLDGW